MIVTVNLDEKLVDAIDKMAEAEKRSRSNMIEVMLDKAVKEQEKKK